MTALLNNLATPNIFSLYSTNPEQFLQRQQVMPKFKALKVMVVVILSFAPFVVNKILTSYVKIVYM